MKALFVIGIILFNLFVLLATPSFGQIVWVTDQPAVIAAQQEAVIAAQQEAAIAAQHEDKVCLQWGWKRPCAGWMLASASTCRPVLSPVKPESEENCTNYSERVCVRWGPRERDCKKWVPKRIDVGQVETNSQRAIATDIETKEIIADALNRRLRNLGLGTINNPILPSNITIDNGRLTFHIHITVTIELVGEIIWEDPVIAVGYDYFIDHGPRVRDIELPKGIGDNRYNLWVFNPELNDFTDSGVELIGGEKYKFEKPVRKFSIRGIEIEAGLDPENQRAFPTGLAFNRTGKVKMRMVPITVDTDKQ